MLDSYKIKENDTPWPRSRGVFFYGRRPVNHVLL